MYFGLVPYLANNNLAANTEISGACNIIEVKLLQKNNVVADTMSQACLDQLFTGDLDLAIPFAKKLDRLVKDLQLAKQENEAPCALKDFSFENKTPCSLKDFFLATVSASISNNTLTNAQRAELIKQI